MSARGAYKGLTLSDLMNFDLSKLSDSELKEVSGRIISPANKRARREGLGTVFSTKHMTSKEIVLETERAKWYISERNAQKAEKKIENRLARDRKEAEKKAIAEKKKQDAIAKKARQAAEKAERERAKAEKINAKRITQKREKEKKEIEEILTKNPHKMTDDELREASRKVAKYFNREIKETEYALPGELRSKAFEYDENDIWSMRKMIIRATQYDGNAHTIDRLQKAWNTMLAGDLIKDNGKPTLENLETLSKTFRLYEDIRKLDPSIFATDFKYELVELVKNEYYNMTIEDLQKRLLEIKSQVEKRMAEKQAEDDDSLNELFKKAARRLG